MAYWLFKTEPDVYSIDDLANEKSGYGVWNGIRNYQARNFLRDQVTQGDQVLIYHSSCKPAAVVGVARVVKAAYADPDQFDVQSPYYDSKASPENPRWYCVDIAFEKRFSQAVTLADIKQHPELQDMLLLKQGRLSVMPVDEQHGHIIEKMAG